MKIRNWLVLLSISILVGYLAPTVQVITEAPQAEWRFVPYSIDASNQAGLITTIALAFFFSVLYCGSLYARYSKMKAYLLSFPIGGLIIIVAREHANYFTLVGTPLSFPYEDVWQQVVYGYQQMLCFGLIVSLVAAAFTDKLLSSGVILFWDKPKKEVDKTDPNILSLDKYRASIVHSHSNH